MKRLALHVLAASLVLVVPVGAQSVDDPYSLNLVSSELKLNRGGRRVIRSWSQKRLPLMGDAISVALLKVMDDSDMKNADRIRDILPVIRDSFSRPELIEVEVDKKPKVTIFLLTYLRHNISDSQIQSEIQQTIEFVQTQTAH